VQVGTGGSSWVCAERVIEVGPQGTAQTSTVVHSTAQHHTMLQAGQHTTSLGDPQTSSQSAMMVTSRRTCPMASHWLSARKARPRRVDSSGGGRRVCRCSTGPGGWGG